MVLFMNIHACNINEWFIYMHQYNWPVSTIPFSSVLGVYGIFFLFFIQVLYLYEGVGNGVSSDLFLQNSVNSFFNWRPQNFDGIPVN